MNDKREHKNRENERAIKDGKESHPGSDSIANAALLEGTFRTRKPME